MKNVFIITANIQSAAVICTAVESNNQESALKLFYEHIASAGDVSQSNIKISSISPLTHLLDNRLKPSEPISIDYLFLLKDMPVIQAAITKAILLTETASQKAGYTNVPVGFSIDGSYCNWKDIDTTTVADEIEAAASSIGHHGSELYNFATYHICLKVTEHFNRN